MDQLVTIHARQEQPDADDFDDERVYQVHGSLWCRVKTQTAGQFIQSELDTQQEKIVITTHYRNDITPDMLLEWQGRKYEIEGLTPLYRENKLTIKAVYTEGRDV